MTLKAQSPEDVLSWALDFETEFLDDDDDAATYAWTVDPDDSPTLLASANQLNVDLSNLEWGTVYRLSLKIVSDDGVEAQRSIAVVCGHL